MSKSVFDKKLSPILSDFLPEFVRADHPKFVRFLKDYFKFLESAELTISGTVNYVAQETISKNYVLDENGDNMFYKILFLNLQKVKQSQVLLLKLLHKFLLMTLIVIKNFT